MHPWQAECEAVCSSAAHLSGVERSERNVSIDNVARLRWSRGGCCMEPAQELSADRSRIENRHPRIVGARWPVRPRRAASSVSLLLRTKRAKAGAAVSLKGMRRLQLCGTTDIGRPGWRSYQVLAALIGTDVLPVDQVWVARRSMQHGPAIANQAPHRQRQAKSGTYWP